MFERTIKPIVLAVGTVFAAALAAGSAADPGSELFAVEEVDRGYDRLADAHGEEGSCGEGNCGEDKDGDAEEEGDDGDDE